MSVAIIENMELKMGDDFMQNIEMDFENAVDNIANNPTEATVRLHKEEIEKAHKRLSSQYFWGYIDRKGSHIRTLTEKLLNKKI